MWHNLDLPRCPTMMHSGMRGDGSSAGSELTTTILMLKIVKMIMTVDFLTAPEVR